MNKDVVQNKLTSLQRCLARIEENYPNNLETLEADINMQDVISINLIRAVQVCVDIASHYVSYAGKAPPVTMSESFEKLAKAGIISPHIAERMKKAVGFRNISVHAYQDIDWVIVYKIVTEHLEDFSDYGQAILAALDAHS
jgi:uncharacterized protein YutE (UPF0331/DUF86 family)